MSEKDHPGASHHEDEDDIEQQGATQQRESEALRPPSNPSSRPQSPLTIAIDFIIANQMSRVKILSLLNSSTENFNSPNATIGEIESHIALLRSEWQKFSDEHEKLGSSARRTLFNHPYMVEDVYSKTFNVFIEAHMVSQRCLNRLKAQAQIQQQSADTVSQNNRNLTQSHQKLPDIVLPYFSGNYLEWPAFRDLFTSLVIDNTTITDVQRMHYLRTILKDNAAQLVTSLPLDGDSFHSAWDILKNRFENKRLLVSAHLSKLTGNDSTIKCTSKDLNHLLNSITESLNALIALGLQVTHWDPLLIHFITQRFSRSLLESWENHLGSSTELPTMEQLTSFLTAKARAQERLDTTHPSTNQSSQQSKNTNQQSTNSTSWSQQRTQKSSTSHTASATTSKKPLNHQYPCDMCGGEHYIVACHKFLSLTPKLRHQGAVHNRLCFNCLGHHNVEQCHSTKTCKTCGQKHHTMLHLNKESNQPSNQSSTQQDTSSQQ